MCIRDSYSATYVTILTDQKDLSGIGLTFTIGKGNDLCCTVIEYFKEFIIGKDIEEIEKDIASIWEKITNHSQLRWVGPQKGVTHLAAAAFFNAIWDLISKFHKKPLWRYIIELETRDLLDKLSFSYIDDVIFCLEKLALDKNISKEIINIGPDEETITINDLAKLVANETGFNGDPIHVQGRPLEVKEASCSSEKARKLLGYKTKTCFCNQLVTIL